MTAHYKGFCSRRDLLSALNFIKPSSGTCAAPPVLSNVGGDDPDNPPTDQEEMSSP
jgi:hypothetical protein